MTPSGTPLPERAEAPVLTPTTELTELDPMTGPAAETAPQVPGLELVAMRKEEPTEAVPITYREYSFAVAPGTEPHELERHARAAWEQVRDAILQRTSQKFVQIALFDHHFEGRPSRPPLAVLAWKDWRGDPVVQIRGPAAPSIAPVSSASILPRPAPAAAPAPVAPAQVVEAAPAPAAPEPTPSAMAAPRISTVPNFPAPQAVLSSPSPSARERPAAVSVAPVPAVSAHAEKAALAAPVPDVAAATAPPAIAPGIPAVAVPTHVPVVEAVPAPAFPTLQAQVPAVSVAPSVDASMPPESALPVSSFDPVPVSAPSRPVEPKISKTPSRPGSSPNIARKRRSGEDVISELFEEMHSLHFAPDIVSGADYVMNVMQRVMPSEGVIVHVFDINTRQFVVVRAAGPNAQNVLLYRTPDTYRLFRSVFRRPRALAVTDAREDLNFQSDRWNRLGVPVKSALCGAVKQGGRYLGVIELANPAGGASYLESDVNALDYICGQFAEFVASRPIVIDEDAVLPKT